MPLIQIASGSTNVSVAGGTLDGNGANINGIQVPAANRVNIDKVIVRNCGQDCILLKGNGNSVYDNELSVTRCDVSGSPQHAGISIQNSTQTVCVDNNCHNNLAGIYGKETIDPWPEAGLRAEQITLEQFAEMNKRTLNG